VLNGQRFHYTEWGAPTAPPLVMLHGVTGHARTWDEEAALLASRYRVLALDQRGHGDSDPSPDADYTVATLAADVAAFADALGLARVSLVGLSMGGRVAIGFAGQAPRRVDRLVIVDIGPEISEAGMLRVGTLMARSPELFTSLEHALSFHRVTNPLYTEAMLRHRVEHGTRAVEGGLTWKYDRGLRDVARPDRSLAALARDRLSHSARARRRLRRALAGDRQAHARGEFQHALRRGRRRRPHGPR